MWTPGHCLLSCMMHMLLPFHLQGVLRMVKTTPLPASCAAGADAPCTTCTVVEMASVSAAMFVPDSWWIECRRSRAAVASHQLTEQQRKMEADIAAAYPHGLPVSCLTAHSTACGCTVQSQQLLQPAVCRQHDPNAHHRQGKLKTKYYIFSISLADEIR